MRKQRKDAKSYEKREELAARMKLMSEHIEREKKEQSVRKVIKVADSLRKKNGGLNENMFWKYKKRTSSRKKDQLNAMINEEGDEVDTEKDIKRVYEQFYKKLLETPKAENENEKRAEEEVEKTFTMIESVAETQEGMIVEEETVRKVIAKLKRGKAGDTQGWTNEMLMEGGDEMVKSVTLMFNVINTHCNIPEEWEVMKIKSIHKKGSKKKMDNRRGLFLTNIVSKLYERVTDEMTRERVTINEHQCGGQKGRSTADNIIMMKAVIDSNSRLNKRTYCYYADAYKCFDRLWLKDCLIELWKAGMREREVLMIYKMNERAKITIETPAGDTNEIVVHEIVRQGTVFGPKLCCVSTQAVNHISGKRVSSYITPELDIGVPVYVDDILGVGDISTVEQVIANTHRMEEEKKFMFSKKKSKYMVTRKGKDDEQPLRASIKEGMIEKTTEYKYLGMWFTEDNNMFKHLQEVEHKIEYMVKEIKRAGHESVVGSKEAMVQSMLYEKIIVPTLTHNMELTTNMSSREYKELEKLQSKAIQMLYGMPQSTPYWGMLFELGLNPLEYEVHYKRLMLYHNLENSSDKRVSKQVIRQQEKYDMANCFYSEILKSAEKIEFKLLDARQVKKSTWKQQVKEKVKRKVWSIMEDKIESMKKLRFLKGEKYGLRKRRYTSECPMWEVTEIMKVRLNMVKIDGNFGKHDQCKVCGVYEESTEHILQCGVISEKMGSKISIQFVDSEDVEELRETARYMRRAVRIIEECNYPNNREAIEEIDG